MPGQPTPAAPLQTLETRLERIEAMLEGIHIVMAGHDRASVRFKGELEQQLDYRFADFKRTLEKLLK